MLTGRENGRVDEVEALESRCAQVWPALVDEPLGQWRLRAAGGFTGRANSALTIGEPDVPLSAALARIITFAQANGIAPKAHVVAGSAWEQRLTDADWHVDAGHPGGAETVVMTGPLPCGPVPAGASVPDTPPDGWWPLAIDAAVPTAAQRHVLAGRPGLGFGIMIDGGVIVGIVRGAVIGELLHVSRLAVASTHRRQGLAVGLLAVLAEWGERRGASSCVLQVAAHNEAALNLYAKLGCQPHHRYRYWIPA